MKHNIRVTLSLPFVALAILAYMLAAFAIFVAGAISGHPEWGAALIGD